MSQLIRLTFALLVGLSVICPSLSFAQPDPFASARRAMVQKAVIRSGVKHPRVIKSMQETPRHEFVARKNWPLAYYDMAIPIGAGQTISSPFIVAYMTESLDPQPGDRVLEVGTGSGYQAAVLSPIVKDVYTIEIVEELGKQAADTLKRLEYKNVYARVGDGYKGWPDRAPFHKIIVTCSPEKVPQPLVDQLAEGGLMVIPVGQRYQQTLYLLRKTNGKLRSESLRPTLFVPMTGKAEDNRQVKPDPARPKVINGTFETGPDGDGFIRGWYYQRQTEWIQADDAPQGDHYIQFKNRLAGRAAHLIQGIAVDGQKVTRLILSARVSTKTVRARGPQELGAVGIIFYDDKRNEVGREQLGPLSGTRPWQNLTTTVAVPVSAREAMLRIGLFGAVGSMSVDDVRVTVAETK